MKKKNKKYYKNLDILRVFACIAILLYHLGILQGGYLAVCVFFVLSGYLSCVSAFQKEKFSFKSYYYKRLLKIYMPLVVIVFISLGIISILPNISWLNLKPETTSILLGYNNFWQLNANLDYFASNISSPFIHLWYISILLQFDLVFPFIFLGLRKIGDKVDKFLPCVFLLSLSLIGAIYFYKMCITQNIMFPYYHTFTRIFSLLFGVSLGFIHAYYGPLILKNEKRIANDQKVLYFYFGILTILFIFVNAQSVFFPISMILTTLITCRLIDDSILYTTKTSTTFDQLIKCFSDMSYEIYLLQYPIIFLFQYISIHNYIKIVLIIILTIILSYIFHFCFDPHHKNPKAQNIKYILCLILECASFFGLYQYSIAKDHTQEMKQLEQQINQNQILMQQKQEEYINELKKEQEVWNSTLSNLENAEKELPNIISNLSIVGIGDSVMLGAINNLYGQFPKGYFDAKVSRSVWVAKDILTELKNKDLLGNPIIINLGTNGDCSEKCKIEIMEACEGRDVFWVTVINDQRIHMNDKLKEFANKYDNLHIIDWYAIANGHTEYFYADGIHLTEQGRKVYTQTIYNSIYQVYFNKYQEKKQEVLDKIEEKKIKIGFYGNEILLNAYETIQSDYPNAAFTAKKIFTYQQLQEELQKEELPEKIVFAFDQSSLFHKEQYAELFQLCAHHKIYLLTSTQEMFESFASLNFNNLTILDFYSILKEHPEYLLADKIHLTKEGNEALKALFKNTIK